MDIEVRKNELLRRFSAMKQRKQQIVEELVADMSADYETKTGKKANYVFVL